MKKTIFLATIALLAISCCPKPTVEGAWGKKSCKSDKLQGFVLNADGTAKTINVKGICLASWQQEGDLLIFNGKKMPCPAKCQQACTNENATNSCKKECEKKCEKDACCKDKCEKKCEKACEKKESCKKECGAAAEEIAVIEPLPEPIEFSDTLTIKELTADSLILATPCGHTVALARLQCEKTCCDKKNACENKCKKECTDKKECCKKECEKKCEKKCEKACDKKEGCENACNK